MLRQREEVKREPVKQRSPVKSPVKSPAKPRGILKKPDIAPPQVVPAEQMVQKPMAFTD